MPRTREFIPEEALNAAMRAFWEKGYGETRYDDLVNVTGVSRKGLYTVFGDKHQLFLASLKNYRSKIVPAMLEGLSVQTITKKDFRDTFVRMGELAVSPEGQNGCLMTKTSVDGAINDPDVKRIVDLHLGDLHARLHSALLNIGYEGARADQIAPYYVGVMQGLFVLAHARADRKIIGPFVSEALAALG